MSKKAAELLAQLQKVAAELGLELGTSSDARFTKLQNLLPDLAQVITETERSLEENIAGVIPGSELHNRWVAGQTKFYRKKWPIN
jgi:hypothetical protein